MLGRIDAVRADMAAAQVDRALVICTTLEEFSTVHGLALAHDNFWCSAGVHPDNEGVEEPDFKRLLALATLPRVVAVGETGLDYYRLNGRSVADMAWQRERFAVHLAVAAAVAKPLVIHTRSASADTLAMLGEAQATARRAGRALTDQTPTASMASRWSGPKGWAKPSIKLWAPWPVWAIAPVDIAVAAIKTIVRMDLLCMVFISAVKRWVGAR